MSGDNLVSLTWHEFKTECQELTEICARLGDIWTWVEKDTEAGNGYLVFQKKFPVKLNMKQKLSERQFEECNCVEDPAMIFQEPPELLINMEYHIIYSVSYQVPVLFFTGHKYDGSQISMEDSWQIFAANTSTNDIIKIPDMLSVLTQMDHPVLFRPYLALHPCKTPELLSNFPKSRNRIITFISLMGPFVGLQLNPEIGKIF